MTKPIKTFKDQKNYVQNFYKGNIMEINYLDTAKVTIAVMEEIISNVFNEYGQESFFSITHLVDKTDVFDESIKSFIANHERLNTQTLGRVILTEHVATRLLIVAYQKFYKPPVPTKVFTKIGKATKFAYTQGVEKTDWEEYLNKKC